MKISEVRKRKITGSLEEPVLADLAASGITEEHSRTFVGALKTPPSLYALSGLHRSIGGYEIPYYDIDGKPNGFRRIKLLGEDTAPAAGGDGLTKKGGGSAKRKALKYWQPRGSEVRAYFPPVVDWLVINDDAKREVWITEGEKKAYCASLYAQPTIGLGGVDSWASKKNGIDLIDDLREFKWTGRNVVIIFDSDAATNPNVADARVRLAQRLTREGARAWILDIPAAWSEGKAGLDDFLVHHNFDPSLLYSCPRFIAANIAELERMNREYVYVRSLSKVMLAAPFEQHGELVLISNDAFKNDAARFEITPPPKVTASGELRHFPSEPAVKHWWRWGGRREARSLVYSPGEELVTDDGEYNLWRASDIEPVKPGKGDLDLYFELRDYLFNAEPAVIEWFEKWVACPLQNPGTKMLSAVLLQSPHQGTGKTLLGMTIGRLYGGNFGVVEHEQLFAPFNQWAERKQFILGDEVFSSDRRKDTDSLKSLITREWIEINKKNVQQFVVRDCINYLLTSNHPDALYLEETDRRFLVVSTLLPPKPESFYREYDAWLRGDGPSYLLWYYQNRIDLAGFNAKAPAPKTNAKETMLRVASSEIDNFVRETIAAPDDVLTQEGDWWTANDLMQIHRPGSTNAVSLGKAMHRAGKQSVQLCGNLWAYCMRNEEFWKDAPIADIRYHYESTVNYHKHLGDGIPARVVAAVQKEDKKNAMRKTRPRLKDRKHAA